MDDSRTTAAPTDRLMPSRVVEIAGELDGLAAATARLGDRIDVLAARLNPILSPARPENPSDSVPAAPPQTDIGKLLRDRTYDLGRHADVVDELLDRLEI